MYFGLWLILELLQIDLVLKKSEQPRMKRQNCAR